MKEIKCKIVQDLLPLYIDEVVSQDTKEMVDEHLQHCEECKKEYETMKLDLYIPEENKDSLFRTIRKKWRKKKVMTSIVSIFVTTTILIGAFLYVFYYETVIPYSEDLIYIEAKNENQLASRYFGESYASVHETHPMQLEIDGETKNVSFIYYTKTIADSPSRNLVNNEKSLNEKEYSFNLAESGKIDAVYYGEFDTEKITSGKDSWEEILKRSTLIWEK